MSHASEMRKLVKALKAGKLTRTQWKAGLDRLAARYPDPDDRRQVQFIKRRMQAEE